MQDRPTAVELITAVRQFLEQELLPAQGDQRLRFRTRVAANALAILQRELTTGPAPVEEEYERLRVLLTEYPPPTPSAPSTTAEERERAVHALRLKLARRIRAGAADDGPWRQAVILSTLASVRAKLVVCTPAAGTHCANG